MTVIIDIIYTSTCIFNAIWPIVCCCAVKHITPNKSSIHPRRGSWRRKKGTNSSHSQQCLFHMTVTIDIIYTFTCIFDAVWPIFCWCAIKLIKRNKSSMCQHQFFRCALPEDGAKTVVLPVTALAGLTVITWPALVTVGQGLKGLNVKCPALRICKHNLKLLVECNLKF